MEESSTERCVLNSIVLQLSKSEVFPSGTERLVMNQAYVLSIKPDKKCITITGSTSAGVFYGAVSLISLLQGATSSTAKLPTVMWQEGRVAAPASYMVR